CALHKDAIGHRTHVVLVQLIHLRWKHRHYFGGYKSFADLKRPFDDHIGLWNIFSPCNLSGRQVYSFRNVTKSCSCVVCPTTRGSIDCFFWAPSCGTSDDDDFDCLFFFSVVLIIVRSWSEGGLSE